VSEPARAAQKTRVVRVFAFPVALSGMVACASILGIDDRSLVDDGSDATDRDSTAGEGSVDGSVSDGGLDALFDGGDGQRPKFCDPGACAQIGGSCQNSVCTISCTGPKSCAAPIECTDGQDCLIECGPGACTNLTCQGSASCTIDCTGSGDMSCAGVTTCLAEDCEFNCGASDCKDKPIICDASICIAHCTGDKACDKGLDFNASTYCGVTCDGTACSADKSSIHCNAPDSSIDCTSTGGPSCGMGLPVCTGPPASTCAIHCEDDASCMKGACCEAGSCDVSPARMCPP
jgi:hypothetical protein